MMTRNRAFPTVLALLAGTAWAAQAHAQATTPPAAEPPVTAGTLSEGQRAEAGQTATPQTATAAANDADIVVTAQRREQRLQDVPATISAFSGNLLERTGIQSTRDLTLITPGLNFTQSSYSPQPTIRGIGTRGVSAGDESVVPVYVDGVYQPVLNATVMDLNSIERVEVLKGPQGTLFGRNATGGAINIITRTPQVDPMMDGSVSYGRYNEVISKLYATGGSGPVAADIAFVGRRDDGYINDIVTGETFGKVRGYSLRSKLRFEPSDSFDATLSYSHVDMHDSTPYATQPQNGNTLARRFDPNVQLPTGQFETAVTDSGELRSLGNSGSATFSLHLDGVNITSISGYQDYQLRGQADSDTTPVFVGNQFYTNFSKSFVQELYATGESDRFNWIVGGTYFHDRSGVDPQVLLTRSFPSGALVVTDVNSSVKTESFAGYIQGSYDLTDALNVTVGGRYTRDRKNFFIVNNRTRATINADHTWSKFTPTGTIQYTFSPDLNVYLKAGQAFKSGIFPSTTFSGTPVDPETVTQYELGLKFAGDSGLRGTLAGFYTKYKNVQVNVRDPITLVSTLENAAAAELYGLDGDIAYTPIERLNLRAGISLIHAEYKDYREAQIFVPTGLGGSAAATIDASGKKLIRTPFVSATAGFDYTADVGGGEASITLNASYIGKSYWEASNRLVEDPRVIANGEVSWGPIDKSYKLSLWVQNLFDERYHLFVLSSTTTDSQVYAKPITFGARASFRIK
jgi:iron complex outermembrane receptor protein